MITAKVYNTEELSLHSKDAITNGLDIIGSHIGRISVIGKNRLRLPTNGNGLVDISKVGYRKLDEFVDLHLIVAPISNVSAPGRTVMGLSYLGSGIAYVNPERLSSLNGVITVAHETAHAFGFVNPEAPQSIPGNPAHCSSSDCVMTPLLTVDTYPDFCSPCAKDMRENIDYNIAKMNLTRNLAGSVTTSTLRM